MIQVQKTDKKTENEIQYRELKTKSSETGGETTIKDGRRRLEAYPNVLDMAARWSSESVVAEHRELQVLAGQAGWRQQGKGARRVARGVAGADTR